LSTVLLLTDAPEPAADVLPSLSLLSHVVRTGPASATAANGGAGAEAVLVDARRDLVQVKRLLRLLRAGEMSVPVLAVVTEGGWAAVTADWGVDDVILHTASPGEVDARLRLAIGKLAPSASGEIRSGDLLIDESTYSVRLRGHSLDLTFKEFELLKFLAQYPGRVFTRAQLLQEVWGYDYFGGTRTVDVHVRRLRAKLGAEYEVLIGTVRNVGYRFVPVRGDEAGRDQGSRGQGARDRGSRDHDTRDQAGGDRTSGDEADADVASTGERDRGGNGRSANHEQGEARSAHAEV
jgi:DNA-binding response OmpR family regulator